MCERTDGGGPMTLKAHKFSPLSRRYNNSPQLGKSSRRSGTDDTFSAPGQGLRLRVGYCNLGTGSEIVHLFSAATHRRVLSIDSNDSDSCPYCPPHQLRIDKIRFTPAKRTLHYHYFIITILKFFIIRPKTPPSPPPIFPRQCLPDQPSPASRDQTLADQI